MTMARGGILLKAGEHDAAERLLVEAAQQDPRRGDGARRLGLRLPARPVAPATSTRQRDGVLRHPETIGDLVGG
jgi:hypothetical protein